MGELILKAQDYARISPEAVTSIPCTTEQRSTDCEQREMSFLGD